MSFVQNTAAIDFENLPNELQGIAVSKGYLLPTYMFDAMSQLLASVDVIQNDGKTPLYTWEFFDLMKKAEDAFNPGKIAELKARIPSIEDFEIDTTVSRSEVMTHFRSYQAWLFGLKSLNEALKGDFAVYFLRNAMQDLLFKKLAIKGFWGGVRTTNQADRGADKNFTGMIKRITDGSGVGGDIPTGNVITSAIIAAANAYAEINEHAQKAYADQDLAGIEKNYYLSENDYLLYCKGRQAASNNTIAPGATTDSPDWMPNIKFNTQAGLAGQDFQLITPKSNLKFSVNDNPTNFNFEMLKVMKGWQLNLLASGGADYGYGRYLYPRFQEV